MELQQMRYALAVAETRNFTRAAERCHVVQSALSHQIAHLERELGVKLFARTSRRVEVTPAGEAFLSGARRCLDAAERAAADAAAASGEVRGRLAVGLIPTVVAVDVPELLARLRDLHPQVRIALQSGPSDEMAARVASGGLDVAFLGFEESVRPAGVQLRELGRDRHVAVLADTHPLAARKRLKLADLASDVFVDFQAGSPGRAQTDSAFAAAGITRDVAFEVSAMELMMRIVQRRLAIALLPSSYDLQRPGLARVAVADGPRRAEYLAWSAFNPSPAARAFVDLVGAS